MSMTNYFSNYMLKYFPSLFTREMLEKQDEILARLRRKERVYIDSFVFLWMDQKGKIRSRDEMD